jgi:hypothetical protein
MRLVEQNEIPVQCLHVCADVPVVVSLRIKSSRKIMGDIIPYIPISSGVPSQ